MSKLLTAILVPLLASPCFATAQTAPELTPAAGVETCGKTLSPPVLEAWARMDGREGRLGCPLESEGDTAASKSGAAARIAHFEGGEIIRHMSGPLAGQAFAVYACDRLYVQFGGESGWLGLPTSDSLNTPDGQRQTFEGGTLRLTRAVGSCDAEKN